MMEEYFCFLGWSCCWCWNFCSNTNAYWERVYIQVLHESEP